MDNGGSLGRGLDRPEEPVAPVRDIGSKVSQGTGILVMKVASVLELVSNNEG